MFHPSSNFSPWSVGTLILSLVLMVPILCVFYLALDSSGEIWRHLVSTSLPIYVTTTLALMLGVGVAVFSIGVGTAWLVTMCRFPGRRTFEWLLIFPLAFPAYVVAYAYTDLLEYAGPVQSSLRLLFGWTTPRDYWFPEIRSVTGAILMMSFVLYPYVYLMARTAFLEMSVNVIEVHRVLGGTTWQTFHRVVFPAARPAIAVGVSLALMETMNDFGTVDHFAVSTMTAGLIDVWLGMGSLAGGAQIAMLMLTFMIALLFVERISRSNQKLYQQPSSRFRELPYYDLHGVKGWAAFLGCL
ncbi:MAG: ABC transporter permease subunit, partial [Pseudomonadota bacterium]|nr:ABC transporter permease subunit [Pseudomonadota bacterium]